MFMDVVDQFSPAACTTATANGLFASHCHSVTALLAFESLLSPETILGPQTLPGQRIPGLGPPNKTGSELVGRKGGTG